MVARGKQKHERSKHVRYDEKIVALGPDELSRSHSEEIETDKCDKTPTDERLGQFDRQFPCNAPLVNETKRMDVGSHDNQAADVPVQVVELLISDTDQHADYVIL